MRTRKWTCCHYRTLLFQILVISGAGLKPSTGVAVVAPTQPHSSSPPPSSLPAVNLSEVTGLNSTLGVSVLVKNLDAQKCSHSRCSGNGRCVETDGSTACVCSLAYSGESCQDHILKAMQGPIIYGGAGLCAGVVIIAMVAVLVKRRRANTRSVYFRLQLNFVS